MLHEAIGTPAMLEQTAEECCELAQACLKMARFLRGENPTTKEESEIQDNLAEEIVDVDICLNELLESYNILFHEKTEEWYRVKIGRIKNRVNEIYWQREAQNETKTD